MPHEAGSSALQTPLGANCRRSVAYLQEFPNDWLKALLETSTRDRIGRDAPVKLQRWRLLLQA